MSKLKVLVVISDHYGVGKFRIIDPYKYIGDKYHNEIQIDFGENVENTDDSFKDYHVVIFHTFIVNSSHEDNVNRIKWLKSKGIKVVMDIDDYWVVDHRHPMDYQIKKNKIGEKKIEFLKLVDHVTTVTPIFRDTIRKKLKIENVHVFPNAIDPTEKQFQPNPTPSDKIRFGWLGGSSHNYDIDLLRNGISSTYHSNKDKSQFVLCGFDIRGKVNEYNKQTGEVRTRDMLPKETVWYQYEKIFTDNFNMIDDKYLSFLEKFENTEYDASNKPYVRRWTEKIENYGKNYNFFDVSLVPLVDSEFNSNKSQLKIIEAGFHKKAVIASAVDPYTLDLVSAFENGSFNSHGNALLVEPRKNHKQWQQHMCRLIENPEMITELGERLYQTVKEKYSMDKVCKDRVEFLKSIVK